MTGHEPLTFEVHAARDGDELGICRVCRDGFALSSRGLLPPDVIEHQADHYYDVDRSTRPFRDGTSALLNQRRRVGRAEGYVQALASRSTIWVSRSGEVAMLSRTWPVVPGA